MEGGPRLGTTRTASIVADSLTIACRLSRTALSEMEEKDLELAAVFHELAVRLLSERLVAANHMPVSEHSKRKPTWIRRRNL